MCKINVYDYQLEINNILDRDENVFFICPTDLGIFYTLTIIDFSGRRPKKKELSARPP